MLQFGGRSLRATFGGPGTNSRHPGKRPCRSVEPGSPFGAGRDRQDRWGRDPTGTDAGSRSVAIRTAMAPSNDGRRKRSLRAKGPESDAKRQNRGRGGDVSANHPDQRQRLRRPPAFDLGKGIGPSGVKKTRTKTSQGQAVSRETSRSSCSLRLWGTDDGVASAPTPFKCVRGDRASVRSWQEGRKP